MATPVAVLAMPALATAQNPADWSASLVIQPFPSPYVSDWERNPSIAVLTITYSGATEVGYTIRATGTKAGLGTVGVLESPDQAMPAGPVAQVFFAREAILEWDVISRNAAFTDAAGRTGLIPEGSYRACAQVLAGPGGVQVAEACADFEIQQPEPPQLIAPASGDQVVTRQPFFSWTPVIGPPELAISYRLKVVEVIGSQTPRAAIDANIPLIDEVVEGRAFLLYPLEGLPLEPRRRYAWRVTTVDADGQPLFRDRSSSEIHEFTMADELLRPPPLAGELPDVVVLQPGVAELRGLRGARVTRDETELGVTGTLSLALTGVPGAPAVPVTVRDLRLGIRADQLSVLDGDLRAAGTAGLLPASLGGLARVKELTYAPADGVRAVVEVGIPGQGALPLRGTLQLTGAGWYGSLRGESDPGSHFAQVGREPVRVRLSRAQLDLPATRLTVGGTVAVLGQGLGCPEVSGTVQDGVLRLGTLCSPTEPLRLGEAAPTDLVLGSLGGRFVADLPADTVGYALEATATLRLLGAAGAPCHATFVASLAPDSLAATGVQPRCDPQEATRVLDGWLRLAFAGLDLARFRYRPDVGVDWLATADVDPRLVQVPGLDLPPFAGVTFDRDGVAFPRTAADVSGITATLDGIRILARHVDHAAATVRWRDWQGLDASPFAFELPGEAQFDAFAEGANSCLATPRLMPKSGMVIRGGRVSWELAGVTLDPGCAVVVADKLEARIRGLEGRVSIRIRDTVVADTLPRATVSLGPPERWADSPYGGVTTFLGISDFEACAELGTWLQVDVRGRLRGRAPVEKTCPGKWKFGQLTPFDGDLVFARNSAGGTRVTFEGKGRVAVALLAKPAADSATKADSTAKTEAARTDSAAKADSSKGFLEKAADALKSTEKTAEEAVKSGLRAPKPGEADAPMRLDFVTGRLLEGEWDLKGPFKLTLLNAFEFAVPSGRLTQAGLLVDGRARMALSGSASKDSLGSSWAGVMLDPVTGEMTSGIVGFDDAFAIAFGWKQQTGTSTAGGGEGVLGVVSDVLSTSMSLLPSAAGFFGKADTLALSTGFQFVLPGSPSIDSRGLRLDGETRARLALRGSRFDQLVMRFEDGFGAGDGLQVTTGRALFLLDSLPIAVWDAAGFHPAIMELVEQVLPARLPLPTEQVAYLQLRDATGELLVDIDTLPDALQLRTTRGPVRLVVPALRFGRSTIPAVNVALDIRIDRANFGLRSGTIVARTDTVASFDLTSAGVPVAFDSLRYERIPRDGMYRFLLAARFQLFDELTPPGTITLELDGAGAFSGAATVPLRRTVALAPGGRLGYRLDELRGTFGGSMATGLDWRLDLPGALRFDVGAPEPWSIASTLRLTPSSASVVDVQAPATPLVLSLPGIDLLLGRPRIPLLRYDAATRRFSFDLLFDLAARIPAFADVVLPTVADIHLRDTGLEIPGFEVPAISVAQLADGAFGVKPGGALRVGGFGIRPLAYRFSGLRWDWASGAPPPTAGGFGVDLELSIADPASPAPYDLAMLTARVLDAGYRDGAWRGTLERVDFPTPLATPVGTLRSVWGTFAAGAGELPHLFVAADLRLPDLLHCDPAARLVVGTGKDTLELLPRGALAGTITDFVPACDAVLGPLRLGVRSSRLSFGADSVTGALRASLAGTVGVALAGLAPGDSVRAEGQLGLDLVTGEITALALAIAQPFVWQPDPENPFLNFVVESASIDRDSLRFSTTGQLRLAGGASVAVGFQDVAVHLPTNTLARGAVTVSSNVAVGVEVGDDGGLAWTVRQAGSPRTGAASALLELPAGITITPEGVAAAGRVTGSLAFRGQEFGSLAAEFRDDFAFGFEPAGVQRGRVRLLGPGDELVATIDSLGFWPGNVFAALPIPARLPLPDTAIAYLQLRDAAGQLLIEQESSAQGIRLRSKPGQAVPLVIPGLGYGSAPPTLLTEFDLVVNPQVMRVVSGSLEVRSAPGRPLPVVPGVPLELTRLGFRAGPGGYAFVADARVALPGELAAVNLALERLAVTPTGFTGVVEVGRYRGSFDPTLQPVVQRELRGDTLAVAFYGARVDFSQSSVVAEVSGALTSSLLRAPNGLLQPMFLTGRVSPAGFSATADLSPLGRPAFSVGLAEIAPVGSEGRPVIGITADATEFAVRFGASITLPAIAPGFRIALDEIRIGSRGVRFSPVSITAPTATAEFRLFGLTFRLRDSTVGGSQAFPAISVAIEPEAIRFDLAGEVGLYGNTTRFVGLQVGTDGRFNLRGANLLSQSLALVPERLFLDSLALDEGALRGSASVRLPEPFASDTLQRLTFRVSPDGQVSGGGTVVLVNEPEGLEAARQKIALGIATFHLRYLAATVDFADPERGTEVVLVSDVYLQNRPDALLRLGRSEGGTVVPGLRVTPAGATWRALEMPRPITVEYDVVRLRLTQATARLEGQGISADFSGELSLLVTGATGAVQFRHVGLRPDGAFDLGTGAFDGGTFVISEAVSLTVADLGWSSAPATITVPDVGQPSGGGLPASRPKSVRVASYLSFGGTATIGKSGGNALLFSGAVKRVVVYRDADDGRVHFLIDSLAAGVPKVLDFTAQLRFDELPDGFNLQVAGAGALFDTLGVRLAGAIGQAGGEYRAGIFMALTTSIPIVPQVVTLAEVGGGLFINPSASDMALVRAVAGLQGRAAARLGSPPADLFAVMLYGALDIVGSGGSSAVNGRALVTVTDKVFRLDGSAVFFGQRGALLGEMVVQVGYNPAYLRGQVHLTVDYGDAASGNAGLEFFVGGNTFAVRGTARFTLVKVISADAAVVVVPSGFSARLFSEAHAELWVLTLHASLDTRIWFRPSTSDLGAYVVLRGSIDVAKLAGAEADLKGVLLLMPAPMVALAGSARAYFLGAEVRLGVWVQFDRNGPSGGLGDNPAITEAIARANQVVAELELEAQRILEEADALVRGLENIPLTIPEAMLAQAFRNVQGWDPGLYVLGVGPAYAYEIYPSNTAAIGDIPYLATYLDVLRQKDVAADTLQVRALRDAARQKLRALADRKAEIDAQLAGLRVTLQAVEGIVFPDLQDPVVAATDGTPEFESGGLRDGREVLLLRGGPSFQLDDRKAAANVAAMTAARAAVAARTQRLLDVLGRAEEGLGRVRAATSAGQSSSLLGYSRLYADAVEAVEHQHAATVDYLMRRRDWARGRLAVLDAERPAFEQHVRSRTQAVVNDMSLSEAARKTALDNLALTRAQVLRNWSGSNAVEQEYLAARAGQTVGWFKNRADELGLAVWSDVARVGLRQADSGATASILAAAEQGREAVAGVRAAHVAFTRELAALARRQVELYGAVFDLYDAAYRELGEGDSAAVAVRARRDAIRPLLEAPRMASATVQVADYGFASRVQFAWSGTHPGGAYEYLVDDGADSLRSVGALGTNARWEFSAEPSVVTRSRATQLLVRGGAGTTTNSGVSYDVTFRAGSAASPYVRTWQPPADATPPAAPLVEPVDGTTGTAADGLPLAWFSDSAAPRVRWSGSDAESGIAGFRYRVVHVTPPSAGSGVGVLLGGSLPTFGGTAAASGPVELLGWTDAGGRTQLTLPAFTVPAGRLARLEVEATNGAGLASPVGAMYFAYDAVAPAWPMGAALQLPVMAVPFGTGILSVAVAPEPPCGSVRMVAAGTPWDPSQATGAVTVVGGGALASVTLTRPEASDVGSGILEYWVRADAQPATGFTAAGWTRLEATGTTVTAAVPYGRAVYLSLVARDRSGLVSPPLVAGPVTMGDPTPPTAPRACATPGGPGLMVRMIAPAEDAESGLVGYQMRVLSGPTVLRDWPAAGTLDWPATAAGTGASAYVPWSPAGAAGPFMVELRGVSGAGRAGFTGSSGPVALDLTPPPAPGVSATFASGKIALLVSAPNDPETGLAGLDVAVTDSRGIVLPWQAVQGVRVGTTELLVTPSEKLGSGKYVLRARLRNGAGLLSAESTTALVVP